MTTQRYSIDRFANKALGKSEMHKYKGLTQSHYRQDGFIYHSSLFEQSYNHLRNIYEPAHQLSDTRGFSIGSSIKSFFQNIQDRLR